MQIIILNDYANIQGGASQVAVSSALGLAKAGYDVSFIYASGKADPSLCCDNIRLFCLEQYDLLSNPSRINAIKTGIWNSDVSQKISNILKNFDKKESIIHIHSWVKALSISALWAIDKASFSSVITLHDYFSICPNGGLYNYQKQSICTLKPMSFSCLSSHCDVRSYPQKLWRVARQMGYSLASFPRSFQNFIYVSTFSKDILSPHLPKNSRFWSVSNPIDIPKAPAVLPHKHQVFSYLGRLSAEKGVALLESVQEPLRFMGQGEEEAKLKAQHPKAEFTGWIDKSLIRQYLGQSRALVFPSELYETQGLSVSEASALGLPSIVAHSCSASESIKDGITGLLFESGNAQDLNAKIKQLAQDPQLAKTLGENAYEAYWKTPKGLDNHVQSLAYTYTAILYGENHARQQN